MSGNSERLNHLFDDFIDDLIKIKVLMVLQELIFVEKFKVFISDLEPITTEIQDEDRNVITYYAGAMFGHYRMPYIQGLRKRFSIQHEYLLANKNEYTMYVFKVKDGWYGALAPVQFR